MKDLHKLLAIIVLMIGVYMVWQFHASTPPLLSGISFILLGVAGVIRK